MSDNTDNTVTQATSGPQGQPGELLLSQYVRPWSGTNTSKHTRPGTSSCAERHMHGWTASIPFSLLGNLPDQASFQVILTTGHAYGSCNIRTFRPGGTHSPCGMIEHCFPSQHGAALPIPRRRHLHPLLLLLRHRMLSNITSNSPADLAQARSPPRSHRATGRLPSQPVTLVPQRPALPASLPLHLSLLAGIVGWISSSWSTSLTTSLTTSLRRPNRSGFSL